MAERRCSFCGTRERDPHHSKRCGSVTMGVDPHFVEWPSDIEAERDRYRQALDRILKTTEREIARQKRRDAGEPGMTMPRTTLKLIRDDALDALNQEHAGG